MPLSTLDFNIDFQGNLDSHSHDVPYKQQQVQYEIDKVVGSERLPNDHDHPSLPYVMALISETMRWHPVAPIGTSMAT
jgi:cytochrome P450